MEYVEVTRALISPRVGGLVYYIHGLALVAYSMR